MNHRVRPGRPSTALDLIEEFRPLTVVSMVLTAINNRELRKLHCARRDKAVKLTDDGRRTFMGTIERGIRSTIQHPTFGYEVTYRRALNVQARLLAWHNPGPSPTIRRSARGNRCSEAYLLSYDIADAKRLRKMHTLAKAFGRPLQYSAFACLLRREDRVRLAAPGLAGGCSKQAKKNSAGRGVAP